MSPSPIYRGGVVPVLAAHHRGPSGRRTGGEALHLNKHPAFHRARSLPSSTSSQLPISSSPPSLPSSSLSALLSLVPPPPASPSSLSSSSSPFRFPTSSVSVSVYISPSPSCNASISVYIFHLHLRLHLPQRWRDLLATLLCIYPRNDGSGRLRKSASLYFERQPALRGRRDVISGNMSSEAD
ncbi:hypothetical protein ACLOJK_015171 [Asimina triloba]